MTESHDRQATATMQQFPTADVARTLGVSPAKIRILSRAGVCTPIRQGRALRFRFQDLVLLRAALGLMNAKVPLPRLRRALAALAKQLTPARPLSGVRVYADGKDVVARAGELVWQPDSGQLLFSFAVDDLARRARVIGAWRQSQRRDAMPRAVRRANAVAYFERGLRLESRGDEGGAEEAYQRALEIDPEMADAYINRGRLAHKRGDVDEASRLYRRALALTPDDPVVHYNLALALEDKDRVSAAVSHYLRALELDPDFADAHFNLARLLESSGHRSQALKHLVAYKRLTET